MKPVPQGAIRIAATIFYGDARAAIDFLTRAFGFELTTLVDGENAALPIRSFASARASSMSAVRATISAIPGAWAVL